MPAHTIKLPFRKLNSILLGQAARLIASLSTPSRRWRYRDFGARFVWGHSAVGNPYFYERRMYTNANPPTGKIANNVQGGPTLIYAMAPSAVPTKKPSPTGSSAANSLWACA